MRILSVIVTAIAVVLSACTADTLEGIVTDEAGTPASGIKVVLLASQDGQSLDMGSAVSSSDGRFSIEYPTPQLSVTSPVVYMVASSDSLLGIGVVRNKQATQRIVCQKRKDISGTVKDSAGLPVADATVRPHFMIRYSFFGEYQVDFNSIETASGIQPVSTDIRGRYVLKGLPSGWRVCLQAQKPGIGSGLTESVGYEVRTSQLKCAVLAGTSNADIVLKPDEPVSGFGAVRGRVVNFDNGDPISGVRVFIASAESTPTVHRTTFSRSNGEFVFDKLPPGTYAVGALESPLPVAPEPDVEVAKDETTTVTLCAVPGVQVQGKVVSADTGEGLPGVMVFAVGGKPVLTASGTDAGRFSVRMLPGTGILTAVGHDQGYGEVSQEVDVPENHNVTGVQMKLPRATVITGNIKNQSGRPVDGALLRLVTERGPVDLTQADSNGNFKLWLGPWVGKSYHLICCDLLTGGGSVLPVDVEAGKQTRVSIILQQPASLSGVLKDDAGNPVEGATVIPLLQLGECRLYDFEHQTQTDKAGRFLLTNLIPGAQYAVRIIADGYSSLGAGADTLPRLESGKTASKEFTLTRLAN